MPILANVLISASSGGLEILSTDLETATKVNVKCSVDVEGKTTAPGRAISEFVSQIPVGEVVVEKLGEEVKVFAKRYSARFATMPTEDFPAIPKIDKGKTIVLDGADFLRAILKVAFAAAQDEGRPALAGVLCEVGKKKLSMVATDGYRLSFQQVAAEGDFSEKIIIPAKTLLEVSKIIGESGEDSGKTVKMVISDGLNQVNFEIGNVIFTSRLIEGEFPTWQKIIPTTFTSKAKIPKDELMKLVRVASIFARDSGSIIKLKFETSDKGSLLTISANNNQVGSNEASCEVELTGPGGEIAFNFRYLLEVLGSIENEDIFFEMIESLNPGRITTGGDNDYFHIVMPVRLQS